MTRMHRAIAPIMDIRPLRSVRMLLVGFLVLLSSCSTPSPTHGPYPWNYSTPEQQGFDSEVLLNFLKKIEADHLDVHSIILMRKDHVFLEFYNYPYVPDTLQHTASVGKSVISALVGIALESGELTGLDTPILDSFPEQSEEASDPRKAAITLRNALTMQAGLNVGDDNNDSILSSIMSSKSWTAATWAQDMVQPPGQVFNYSSFVSHLISQVLERAIDSNLVEYARKNLFDPIGIGELQIDRDPDGKWFGKGSLWMTSQDMLRFGRLYLNHGKWNGEQVVPKHWVRDSTRNQVGNQSSATLSSIDARYGYQWWVFDGAYAAIGSGGQLILVIPGLDLVAVVTRADETFDIAEDLLRALKSAFWKAKANPDAVAELNSQIEKMGKPTENLSTERPSLERAISGQRFEFTSSGAPDWAAAYRSFTLYFEEEPKLSRLQLESDSGIFEVSIGSRGAPLFTDAGDHALRPDKASQFAAAAWWTDDNVLEVDINEVGYPIKERWNFTFNDHGADVTVQIRGAVQGEWSYVATPGEDSRLDRSHD